jgi:hypothetical protein
VKIVSHILITSKTNMVVITPFMCSFVSYSVHEEVASLDGNGSVSNIDTECVVSLYIVKSSNATRLLRVVSRSRIFDWSLAWSRLNNVFDLTWPTYLLVTKRGFREGIFERRDTRTTLHQVQVARFTRGHWSPTYNNQSIVHIIIE